MLLTNIDAFVKSHKCPLSLDEGGPLDFFTRPSILSHGLKTYQYSLRTHPYISGFLNSTIIRSQIKNETKPVYVN
jgi:hypothetical protein